MNKKDFLIVLLILTISLLTGCNQTQDNIKLDEEIEVEDKGVQIEYPRKYEEDIFGDLSKEEINEIVDGIYNKIFEDDKYKKNTDLAIEEVFKEHDIIDKNNLEAAKDKIMIYLKR